MPTRQTFFTIGAGAAAAHAAWAVAPPPQAGRDVAAHGAATGQGVRRCPAGVVDAAAPGPGAGHRDGRHRACRSATAARRCSGSPVDVVGFSTVVDRSRCSSHADQPDVVRRLADRRPSSLRASGIEGRDQPRPRWRPSCARDAGVSASAVLMSAPWAPRAPAQRALKVVERGTRAGAHVGVTWTTCWHRSTPTDVFDVTARLPGITAPTLVVGGGRDRLYGEELFAGGRRPAGRSAAAPPGQGARGHPVEPEAPAGRSSRFLGEG